MIEIVFNSGAIKPLKDNNLNNIYLFDKDYTIGDISNIKLDIDFNEDIRIWTSKKSVQEYLNFLLFCKYYNGNISVIFVDRYSSFIRTIGEIDSKEIDNLLKLEKKLSDDEKILFSIEWDTIMKDNSEIRLFSEKNIISVNYKYLNEYIKKYYDKNLSIEKNIGKLMSYDDDNNISFEVWEKIISKLNTEDK